MAHQKEQGDASALEQAKQRQERITLRFPPPIQAEQAPQAEQPHPAFTQGATPAEPREQEHEDWFQAGEAERPAQAHTTVMEFGSVEQTALRVGTLRAGRISEGAQSTPPRRFVAVLVFVLLSSLGVIVMALAMRASRPPSADANQEVRADSLPIPRASAGSVKANAPEPSVPVPAKLRAAAAASEQSASAIATGHRGPPSNVAQERLPGNEATRLTITRSTSPRRGAALAGGAGRNNYSRREAIEPGIPFSEIFVNRRGELVDAQGKPLNWDAPRRSGLTEAAKDAGD